MSEMRTRLVMIINVFSEPEEGKYRLSCQDSRGITYTIYNLPKSFFARCTKDDYVMITEEQIDTNWWIIVSMSPVIRATFQSVTKGRKYSRFSTITLLINERPLSFKIKNKIVRNWQIGQELFVRIHSNEVTTVTRR